MHLNCPNCGAEIPADNIHLDRMLAKCSACNAVFSFADEVGEARGYHSSKQINIPTPQGIEVDNFDRPVRGEMER